MPAAPEAAFATVDTRDVAAFVVHALEAGLTGTYNTTGAVIDWRTWVATCSAVTGGDAAFTWVDDPAFLVANAPDREHPWDCYPMAMPPDWGDWWSCSSARAERRGLAYRPCRKPWPTSTPGWRPGLPGTAGRQG